MGRSSYKNDAPLDEMEYNTSSSDVETNESGFEDTNQTETEVESLTTEETKTEPKTVNGVVHGASLVNVRKEPKKEDGNVVDRLREGDKVEIVGKEDEFYKINYGRRVGYISCEFCKEE